MLTCLDLMLNSIDYIVIVDKEFNVVFNSRYEHSVNKSANFIHKLEYLNQNVFKVYPNLDKANSSIIRSMTTGEIIVKKTQSIIDFNGETLCTHNITIPLISKGIITGVVELAKDVTTLEFANNYTLERDSIFDAIADTLKNGNSQITFSSIITKSSEIIEAKNRANILSKIPNPTLIYGETGTGKELFAQAMITESGVDRTKVVTQNCAAIPENLFESILFGAHKGAYTGAENISGLFEQADGGILFLDELNAMPYAVQGKLLRVLQDGSFRKLGSNVEKRVKVKIIAAMNMDPVEAMEKKIIRADLFYRFSSSMIFVPPLRERKEDIKLYIDFYINEFNKVYHKNVIDVSDELLQLFNCYNWDGNVRELKHLIESMISITKKDVLNINDVPKYVYNRMFLGDKEKTNPIIFDSSTLETNEVLDLNGILENQERELIKYKLNQNKGNLTKTAKSLKIARTTLKYRIAKLGL